MHYADEFATDLDYVTDDNGEMAILYAVPLSEVIAEIERYDYASRVRRVVDAF